MKLKPIQDQVVVLVGATSGIGRATALAFADRGAKVIVSGRSQPELDRLAQEIRSRGGRASAFAADVTDFNQLKNLADRVYADHGRIDTWVNLAAVVMYATFEQTTPEEFRRIIEVNLLGQAYGDMAALPYLKQGGGALIHISSIDALRSLPLESAYSASKHGIVGFVDSLRLELEHEHQPVSVTNIMPGSINTPLFDKALTKLGVKPLPYPPAYPPEMVAKAILFAAEHPVRDLIVGDAAILFSIIQRVSPWLADSLLRPSAFRLQRTRQPKSADAPNNLFHHLEGYDHVHGEFQRITIPASPGTWWETHPVARTLAAGSAVVTALAAGVVLAMPTLRAVRFGLKVWRWR